MNQKSLYVVFASALLILFVLIYQGSYAYFTASITDNRGEGAGSSNLTTADLQDIVMVDGKNTSFDGWIPGDTHDFSFSINNQGSVDLCVNLIWTDIVNDWVHKEDLVFKVTDSEGNEVIAEKQFPSITEETDTVDLGTVTIKARNDNQFTLTVTYKNDPEESQNEDMGKTFSAKITGQLTECPNTSSGGGL